MVQLGFLDEVQVRPRAGSEFADLDGRFGAVLGVSGPQHSPEAYAVAVDGYEDCIMLTPSEIQPTGARRKKTDNHDGTSVQVSAEGKIRGVRHSDDA
jgi:hypothetical protein